MEIIKLINTRKRI